MADAESKSWLRRRVEKTLVKGLTRAYSTVQVDPARFLVQLRSAYRLPISGYHGVYSLEMGELDVVADELIRSGMKLAALEGRRLWPRRFDHHLSRSRHLIGHHHAHHSEAESGLWISVQHRQ